MVNIEPYQYQKVTNVKEHNDIVAKINEIVDVINDTNMDTIIPRIAKIETDITGINSTDALQWQDIESVKGDIGTITPKITKLEQDITGINSTDAIQNTNISNLKTKDSEHDTRLGTIDTEITDITKSLVSNVAILTGTTSGNVKVRIGRQDAPSINSNDYNIQKPTSIELVQGSAPAMVKAQITLSDGTVLISDDFMFTTAPIGEDVYISSFVFKNGNVAGSISADIGLSNGSTLTANNFAVPTDPNVTTAISDIQGRVTTVENDVSGLKTTVNGHTTSINGLDSEVSDLQTRMTKVEGGSVAGFEALKTTVDGHTASISTLGTDVANLQIDKADVSTVDTLSNTINGKVNIAQGSGNAGKVLGINASGNVEPTEVSGGEEWEEVNLSNLPTNWVNGDKIKIEFKVEVSTSNAPNSWTTAPLTLGFKSTKKISNIIECEIFTEDKFMDIPITIYYNSNLIMVVILGTLYGVNQWNTPNYDKMYLKALAFNGGGLSAAYEPVTPSNISTYVNKMWRLKK